MADDEYGRSELRNRVEAYAAWVKDLRLGKKVDPPLTGDNSPLSRLGRELRLLADTISRREAETQKLFDIIHEVERGVLVEDVLEKIYDGFAGLIPYERIGCAFLSDDGATLTAYWAKSKLGAVQLTKGYSQSMSGSSLVNILHTHLPRILNDLPAYLAAKPNSNSTQRIVTEGGRANLTCPLIVEGRPIGFLFFTSNQENTYKKVHQTIFQQIAAEVAVVIHKSHLYQRLIEANRDMTLQSRRLREIASHDPLTGILNRAAIMAAVDRQIEMSGVTGKNFGVIMVDIGHFKQVNDTHGHAAGDEVLRELVRRVSTALRRTDDFGRYGGEEFLVLIGDTSRGELLGTAEHLRWLVACAPVDLGGTPLQITASFGVAFAPDAGISAAELLKSADDALYAAKAGGRNRCEAADSAPSLTE